SQRWRVIPGSRGARGGAGNRLLLPAWELSGHHQLLRSWHAESYHVLEDDCAGREPRGGKRIGGRGGLDASCGSHPEALTIAGKSIALALEQCCAPYTADSARIMEF